MRLPLQRRFFFWLLTLLGVFILLQTLVYGIIEFWGWAHRSEERLSEQMMEVVYGVGWNLVLTPFLAGVAWWISRRMIDPIREIDRSAGAIMAGQFDSRIGTAAMPDDEMRHLAEALNAAFDRYAHAVEQLRRFSGNVSHQLRNPLAAIRSIGEVALTRDRPGEDYRVALVQILDETSRLTKVIDQLLRLAHLERKEIRATFKSLDLAAVVRRVEEAYRPLCEAKSIGLRLDLHGAMTLHGNEELLFEMLANLVDNSIRYTPEGGEILIRGETPSPASVVLTVSDTGPGIPAEQAGHLFDRRAARSGDCVSGSGLGLAIVAEIARAHGGGVEWVARSLPGATFTVRLPVG